MDKTEDINSFIDDIISGELKQAGDTFSTMMGDRITDSLDQVKVDVADRMFGEGETEGDIEITDELDDIDMGEDDDDFDAEE